MTQFPIFCLLLYLLLLSKKLLIMIIWGPLFITLEYLLPLMNQLPFWQEEMCLNTVYILGQWVLNACFPLCWSAHSTVEHLCYSIENNYFGGDYSILLELSQFLDMLWCMFFHKNQSSCLRLFTKML